MLILFSGCEPTLEDRSLFLEEARGLAKKILILDTHIDVPHRMQGISSDLSSVTSEGEFDYPRARSGGLDAAFMSIYVPASQQAGGARQMADRLIDFVESMEEKWPHAFEIVTSVEQVERAFGTGRVGLGLGMENGAGIEEDLANLTHFYKRGIRYITLTHSKNNAICDSSYDPERRWNGLSPFGREVVREMNRLGIMIDVSHVSDETFWQVLELSQAPVIASHSSCRRFTPGWERNMSDDMIRSMARNDGVIQINFGAQFIDQRYRLRSRAIAVQFRGFLERHRLEEVDKVAEAFSTKLRDGLPTVTVADVADHIDHVVELVGVDHVGFGSDFDGVGGHLPVGLGDVSAYPHLLAELLARGYNREEIEKISSKNLLRTWSQVESLSQSSIVR